jgi:hypothetical protein
MASILPEVDQDEAYCVRHGRDMSALVPLILSQGAFYTCKENFRIYACKACLSEIFAHLQHTPNTPHPKEFIRAQSQSFFDQWDNGDAPGEWFVYYGEAPDESPTDGRPRVWLKRTHEAARRLAEEGDR